MYRSICDGIPRFNCFITNGGGDVVQRSMVFIPLRWICRRSYLQESFLLVDSRLSMACNSYWMGCSKCKSCHERFLGTFEKALVVSSALNAIHVVLCSFLGYGIACAAWATMASQIVAACMMIGSLNKKGYNAFALSVPSLNELWEIVRLVAPVFITIGSKVSFYSLIISFATSMGTHTVAGHQIMIQTYSMCVV